MGGVRNATSVHEIVNTDADTARLISHTNFA